MDLPDAEHVVAKDCLAVAHKEHPSLLLVHQQVGGLLAAHAPKVPAGNESQANVSRRN